MCDQATCVMNVWNAIANQQCLFGDAFQMEVRRDLQPAAPRHSLVACYITTLATEPNNVALAVTNTEG